MNIFQIIANFIRKILTPPIEDESQVDSGITIVPNPPAGQQPILKSNNTVGSSNLTAPSQSYIPPISTQPQVDVLITRQKGDSKQTPGNLLAIVQGFACSTLELPWLNNAHSISCIPDGIYKCVYTYQGDLKEYHYELQNVPDRDGIFMHEGNYFFNSEGCFCFC